MNTPENKAKFFAQYWGQKIMKTTTHNEHCVPVDGESVLMLCNPIAAEIETYFLELNPLSSVTEDHMQIMGFNRVKPISIIFKEEGWYESESSGYFTEHDPWVIGVLRGNGFPLPWCDSFGNQISIDDQIEYGWIKLKNK
ncbi:MAG: hypothetical protein ACI8Q1_000264 [Parvicella sp.]|jgi:hypothetical protein